MSSRETGIFLALPLVVLATTVRNPTFLFSADGWRDLLLTPSIVAVVAIGQAVVIITRNVDLSVGSIVGLTAYLVGTLFVAIPGLPGAADVRRRRSSSGHCSAWSTARWWRSARFRPW